MTFFFCYKAYRSKHRNRKNVIKCLSVQMRIKEGGGFCTWTTVSIGQILYFGTWKITAWHFANHIFHISMFYQVIYLLSPWCSWDVSSNYRLRISQGISRSYCVCWCPGPINCINGVNYVGLQALVFHVGDILLSDLYGVCLKRTMQGTKICWSSNIIT